VKSRISAKSWQRRVEQARQDEGLIRQVLDEVAGGASLNEAMARRLSASRRSWALRRIPEYRQVGFEALIDTRTPREPKVAQACRQSLQAARAANARVTMTEALQVLGAQGIAPLPSESTIKREFARVDDQREYAVKKRRAAHEVVELPFAGGELLLAAEAETGGIAALTATVMGLAEKARVTAQGQLRAGGGD